MSLAPIPYGSTFTSKIYQDLKGWYDRSEATPGCRGCLERVGKCLLVSPLHYLSAELIVPVFAIYDLAMAVFFGVAALCTLFIHKGVRDRLCGHLYSLVMMPRESVKHFLASLFPPIMYKGEDANLQARI